ncbi:MAG: agmatine deiminase family protein [Chlorobi bacterium]|nr:agmatine deiminase family protein [Chlorobiota bacterium]MCI0716874.1 agmatine deiminase family protein [Chlorobiota bacterium]
MKYLLFPIFIILIVIKSPSQDNFLPHYMTEEEKVHLKYYYKNPQKYESDDPDPPPTVVRTIAEWEELSAVQITWTSFLPILRQVVDYAQEECLVYIICSDSNSVKSYLTSGGVPLYNIKYLITGFNSIWCRDYGPWTVYSNVMDTLRIIDWIYNRPLRPLDNATPIFIANYMGVPIHQTINAPNDLVNTGGNFMVDGHGTGFASKLILSENGPNNPYGVSVKTEAQINSIMNAYMGISRYIKMDVLPYDQIHHIDMHMKLLDEETLLVGEYPPGIADGPQIELNLQYVLNNFQTCFNKQYKVVRIPMPPHNGNYPPTGNYRTYTNSIFINKTIIVPTYEYRYDTTGLRIYREALPGYNVVGIDCNSIIPSLGAIHCIVKEIGVREPVFISHSALRNTNNTTQPYEVKAYIKTKSGVANARMLWSIDTTQAFTQVNMTNTSDTFRANIPPQQLGTKVYYYISATSNNNRTVTKPLTAPRGNIQFLVTNTSGITLTNSNVPQRFTLYQNYPNPFNPVTQIKFDIPKSSRVTLKIYDITGREIVLLTDAQLNAGTYGYEWEASNYSSGIYFFKLETKDFSSIKKMILVK